MKRIKSLGLILLLFTCLVNLQPTKLLAAESQWHWVKVDNHSVKWNVYEGMADVSVVGEKFTAKLYLKNDPKNIAIELKGTLKNGKLKVVETILNTDADSSTYTGTYIKKKYNDSASIEGTETINLSDGFSMIGLIRGIPKQEGFA